MIKYNYQQQTGSQIPSLKLNIITVCFTVTRIINKILIGLKKINKTAMFTIININDNPNNKHNDRWLTAFTINKN